MRTLGEIAAPGRNNFSAIRLAAAVAVLAAHSSTVVSGRLALAPGEVPGFDLGGLAVDVFFVLSGVMISASLERSPRLMAFAFARVMRIMPAVVVYALFVALVVGPVVTARPLAAYFEDAGFWRYIARTMLIFDGNAGLPGVFGGLPVPYDLNIPLWTLKYEAACYLGLVGLSLAGILASDRRLALFLAVFALVALAAGAHDADVAETIGAKGHVVRFASCFLIGVAAYRWRDRLPLSPPVAAALLVLWWLGSGTFLGHPLGYVALGYGALVLAMLPGGPIRRLTDATDLSYGIYIYGWLSLQVTTFAVPGLHPLGTFLLALPLAAACAAASWHFVEAPVLAYKKHWLALRSRTPVGAAP
ncbi:acyltransferase family protein [Labrys wisconsinensis]|uniref:Peptidoglycan/LPS O-acetylase OafA/YrhL n=1 Tax=Labrys wisconsinensis TaxID=425677 RepID=A0ABU0J5F6_9HYPH|nr:acyltransferase [Labrys wisconsinensis]MDQ0468422.1 peptidoglycan/LPS O-acetylase OafA/YrhL [Labrys wisconsinensis]